MNIHEYHGYHGYEYEYSIEIYTDMNVNMNRALG